MASELIPEASDSFRTSLWHLTSIPGRDWPRLTAPIKADVVVIGAGYTGLSTALELADNGQHVVVLDAREPGFGASGRNGGQVIPAFKYDPENMAGVYGAQMGEAVLQMVESSADCVFGLIKRFDIDCDARQTGWIQGAYGKAGRKKVQKSYSDWAARGAPVELLNAEEMHQYTGTKAYDLGIMFRNGGTVQPLSFSRGLANKAADLGAEIFGHSAVRNISRQGEKWSVQTDKGSIVASKIVIATNGYTTQFWPGIQQSIVPLYSLQVATDPLPSEVSAQVLPRIEAFADNRNMVQYMRKDKDGRFVIGSRGPWRPDPSPADCTALISSARALFPALAEAQFSLRWAGRVAMTSDRIPHLHQLAPGVFAGLGYNGRGVGLAMTMGRVLAAACLGAAPEALSYPTTDLHKIPFHTFHRIGVSAMVGVYRVLDKLA